MQDSTPSPLVPDTSQPPAGFVPNAAAPNPAADLIRLKLNQIYAIEPDASTELAEAEAAPHRSPHQQFMHELSTSGKDLATIQTEWHNYYVQLDDKGKHEVWKEFYSSSSIPKIDPVNNLSTKPGVSGAATAHVAPPSYHVEPAIHTFKTRKQRAPKKRRDLRSTSAIRAAIRDQVTANGKLTAKHHVQSLLFGLGVGGIVIFIFLFGFFNEVIIAPFIQPSRAATATPIIVNAASIATTPDPQVIIPKINVQIPTDYNQTSTDEATIENALEGGIVHYPTTSLPGQQGNAAYFGHSSNNIFNKGKYKFAFVLLHLMVPGDTFYLTYNHKIYVYKVISKDVVDPSQVEVLNAVPNQTATATLITCDPPGTSLKRLVVVGQQISPDPLGNVASAATPSLGTAALKLPGNGPTLGGRVVHSGGGKVVLTVIILGVVMTSMRWLHRSRHPN